ncbi:hypothetical protein PsorP6_007111 [Peronosclerospora sorghi]|uniref:Uncharacterized protein n=1 Tax=Peronosclerospora sorghi TaxID=230839 RepID=A0ACC0W9K0_9STRA|nr:hypothetical protein PsorP6_007111 [Peronosclerospora sorghi]
MTSHPLPQTSHPSVRPVRLEPPFTMAHTCEITFSPVKRGSRDIIETIKNQCECSPRFVSMGEYVASPRVATARVGFSKESDYLLAESSSYYMEMEKTDAKEQQQRGKSSLWISTFTLTSTILGSGTLAVPFAIASSGWLLGNAIMLCIAMITQYSVHLLLSASDRVDNDCAKTYETVLTISVHEKWMITVVVVATANRRIGNLRMASVLAILSIGYVVAFVLAAFLAASNVEEAAIAPGVQAIRLEPGSIYTVTLLISAFACHNTALPVYEELKERSLPRMNRAVIGGISVAFILYEIISLCGYLHFGADTRDNILLNFSTEYAPQSSQDASTRRKVVHGSSAGSYDPHRHVAFPFVRSECQSTYLER